MVMVLLLAAVSPKTTPKNPTPTTPATLMLMTTVTKATAAVVNVVEVVAGDVVVVAQQQRLLCWVWEKAVGRG